MTSKYIWIKGKRYYLFDTYTDKNKVRKVAMYYKRKNNKYFILTEEVGLLLGSEKRYLLYLNKTQKLW